MILSTVFGNDICPYRIGERIIANNKEALHPPHNHLCQQFLRPRHNRSAAEEQAHEVEFQQVGFLAEFRGVVDARAVLLEGGVAARIFGGASIDRYFIEGAASAAQGFQGDGQHGAAHLSQVRS